MKMLGGRVLIERESASEGFRPDSVIVQPEMSRGAQAEAARYAVGIIRDMGPGMKVGKSPKWKGGPDYRWPMPDAPIGARVVYRTWAVRASYKEDGKNFDVVSDEVVDVVVNAEGATVSDKFRPLFDRVLVKRHTAVEKTPGGIIIPEIAREKEIKVDVLAVGQGRIEVDGSIRPLDVKVGDTVLIGKFSGTEIQVDGVECLILREEDLLGIVVDPPSKTMGDNPAASIGGPQAAE